MLRNSPENISKEDEGRNQNSAENEEAGTNENNKLEFAKITEELEGKITVRENVGPQSCRDQQIMNANSSMGGELWNVEEATPIATETPTDIFEKGTTTSIWVRRT